MNQDLAKKHFNLDIARHEMTVIRDDGVNRHIRFQRPRSKCMHFDLVTWPGYLCYTGDMGTYVFRRLEDMFQFFRRPADRKPEYGIDLRYWAEKLEAVDRCDGIDEFSADIFRSEVKDYFEHATDDEEWTESRKAELWGEIESEILDRIEENGEHGAFLALRDFNHDGFEFVDWERDCKEYSHRFLWCCHALEWAIGVYDAATPVALSEA